MSQVWNDSGADQKVAATSRVTQRSPTRGGPRPTQRLRHREAGESVFRPMRILLAIDDSKFSEAAAEAVIERTRPQDTEVRVIHVVEPPPLLVAREMGESNFKLEEAWEAVVERAQAFVESTAKQLRSKGFKVSTVVEQGEPRSKIVDMASAWNADLVVLGSQGRKGLDRFLMGSVSEAVVRHAHCSVEVVRIRTAH